MRSLKPVTKALHSLGSIIKTQPYARCLDNRLLGSLTHSRHITYTLYKSAPSTQPSTPKNPIDPITLHRLDAERRAYYKRRSYYSAAGFVTGMLAIWLLATSIDLPPKPTKADSQVDKQEEDPLVVDRRDRRAVVQKFGEELDEGDVVETGTSIVPTFPRLLGFLDTPWGDEVDSGTIQNSSIEYQLVGLGIRTVSFLKIQVYVVGLYIATDDIAALQEALIRRIDPIATTLVTGEKQDLKNILLDPVEGEKIWSQVIKDTPVRTIVRIVPVRDTDFGHLRDGWVRAITARAKNNPKEFGDEAFGGSVNTFKSLFRKGNIPKKRELLLARDQKGALTVWYDDGKTGSQRLGNVLDERISRAVWLNYLAGKTVASEKARQNIVNGVMEFVERPVGTVASQVHV